MTAAAEYRIPVGAAARREEKQGRKYGHSEKGERDGSDEALSGHGPLEN